VNELKTAIATTLPCLLALAAADALAAACGGDAVPPGAALLAFGYLVFVYVAIGCLPLALAAVFARSAFSRWRKRSAERFSDEVGAAGIAFVVFGVVAYRAAVLVPAFHNVQLAAALAATVIAASLLALAAALPKLTDALRIASRRISPAFGAAAGGASVAAVVAYLAVLNRSGVAQLPRGSVVVPLAAVAVLTVSQTLFIRPLSSRLSPRVGRVVAALLAVGVGAATWSEIGSPSAVELVSDRAPVGRYVAAAIRAASDFDGDGAAPLLGGGDCRPFDADIGPNRAEVPGDGLDNNCVSGDAVTTRAAESPSWHALPAGFEPPNVLLVTVEALRADRVGFLGYSKPTTPNLDALAARGVVFERAYAPANYTRLSLPSLFTSRHPSSIVWRARKGSRVPRIGAENPWLPEMLAKRGYATAAFHVSFPAFNARERIGFDRGFGKYDASAPLDYRGGTMRGFPSDALVERIAAWIAAHRAERFFVWTHLMEPHFAYERHPKSPDFGADPSGLYDAEVWAADRALGRLLEALDVAGVAERTAILVVGDHGEALSEHGMAFHGHYLYDEEVRTAAVLAVPGFAPRRVNATVSFYDFAPTLANLCGLDAELGALSGGNLVGAMLGEHLAERDVYLEKWSIMTRQWYTGALVRWPYKLISTSRDGTALKLFDLARDPKELEDLSDAAPAAFAGMKKALISFIDSGPLEYR